MRKILFALLISCCGHSSAAFYSFTDFQKDLAIAAKLTKQSPSGDVLRAMWVTAYIARVVDAIHGVGACPPPDFTLDKALLLVTSKTKFFPESFFREAPPSLLIENALKDAFPCKK